MMPSREGRRCLVSVVPASVDLALALVKVFHFHSVPDNGPCIGVRPDKDSNYVWKSYGDVSWLQRYRNFC